MISVQYALNVADWLYTFIVNLSHCFSKSSIPLYMDIEHIYLIFNFS